MRDDPHDGQSVFSQDEGEQESSQRTLMFRSHKPFPGLELGVSDPVVIAISPVAPGVPIGLPIPPGAFAASAFVPAAPSLRLRLR